MKKLVLKLDVVDKLSPGNMQSAHGGNVDAMIINTSGRPNTAVSCASCGGCPPLTIVKMPQSVGGCPTWMTC